QVAGKLFRIGHLGELNELMLLGALAGVELTLRDVGIPVTLGSGVAAAQESFRATQAPLPGIRMRSSRQRRRRASGWRWRAEPRRVRAGTRSPAAQRTRCARLATG